MNIWRKVSDEAAPEGDDVYFTDGLTIWRVDWEFDPCPECWWTTGAELLEASGFDGPLPLDPRWRPIIRSSFCSGCGVWLLDEVSGIVGTTDAASNELSPGWTHWQPLDKPQIRQERPQAKVPTRPTEDLSRALREAAAGRKP